MRRGARHGLRRQDPHSSEPDRPVQRRLLAERRRRWRSARKIIAAFEPAGEQGQGASSSSTAAWWNGCMPTWHGGQSRSRGRSRNATLRANRWPESGVIARLDPPLHHPSRSWRTNEYARAASPRVAASSGKRHAPIMVCRSAVFVGVSPVGHSPTTSHPAARCVRSILAAIPHRRCRTALTGAIRGASADLARELGKRINVPVELEPAVNPQRGDRRGQQRRGRYRLRRLRAVGAPARSNSRRPTCWCNKAFSCLTARRSGRSPISIAPDKVIAGVRTIPLRSI